jgi:hypothetical protein
MALLCNTYTALIIASYSILIGGERGRSLLKGKTEEQQDNLKSQIWLLTADDDDDDDSMHISWICMRSLNAPISRLAQEPHVLVPKAPNII